MLKILMPAGSIPVDSTVTKRTGDKKYMLRDRIRIFGEDGGPREIKASDGARFLVAQNGDANAVNSTTELLWYAEESDLIQYLAGIEK